MLWHHGIRRHDIHHYSTQHNDIQHNHTQLKGLTRNTQALQRSSIMLSVTLYFL